MVPVHKGLEVWIPARLGAHYWTVGRVRGGQAVLSEHCSLVRGSWPHGVEVVVQDHWPPHFFVGRLAGSEMLKEMKLVLTNLVWGRCCWGLASPPIRVRRRAEREDGAARRRKDREEPPFPLGPFSSAALRPFRSGAGPCPASRPLELEWATSSSYQPGATKRGE